MYENSVMKSISLYANLEINFKKEQKKKPNEIVLLGLKGVMSSKIITNSNTFP